MLYDTTQFPVKFGSPFPEWETTTAPDLLSWLKAPPTSAGDHGRRAYVMCWTGKEFTTSEVTGFRLSGYGKLSTQVTISRDAEISGSLDMVSELAPTCLMAFPSKVAHDSIPDVAGLFWSPACLHPMLVGNGSRPIWVRDSKGKLAAHGPKNVNEYMSRVNRTVFTLRSEAWGNIVLSSGILVHAAF